MTAVARTTEAAMRRALELAALGPAGGPNPQVGCVLLTSDGTVLAEGYHRGAGTAHAEVDALRRVAPGAAVGATAVVTLEPCDHQGRTGPCTAALIDAGIARVVFALRDPHARAAGGADRLRTAGIEVLEGVLADESAALNERWLAAVATGRPWVTAKWASSLDGRVAAADGTSRWITGPAAREDVHRRRAQHGAVVVGTGTALVDDPALTARAPDGTLLPVQPVPVVVGERNLPAGAAVHAHPRPLLRIRDHDPYAVLAAIAATGVTSVFLEGGPTLVSAFLAAGLVDEVLVYLAPTLLGGPRVATADLGVATITDQLRLDVREVRPLGTDLLVVTRPHPAEPRPRRPEPHPERTDMFTGIIEERGRVVDWATAPDGGARLTVSAPLTASDAARGDSIAVSGVCLTVVEPREDRFTADVMGQTLAVTALADLAPGDEVNLERAAKVGGRLGGHIVQGHVDGTAGVLQRRDEGSWRILRFRLPAELAPLVVDKGSIAVAGVSLTVSGVGRDESGHWFEVSLIPETLEATTLGAAQVGDRMNLETDVLARHVQRMLAFVPAAVA